MEEEILKILKNIDLNVELLKIIFLFIATMSVINVITNFRDRIKRASDDDFRTKLDSGFQKGEYHNVITKSEERLKNHPNDAIAIWWIARCHKELGNFDKSREYFTRLHMLEPGWRKEFIEPYINVLEVEEQDAKKSPQPTAESGG